MKPLIIANWKLNKTEKETLEWIEEISRVNFGDAEIVVCSSFTLLPIIRSSDHPFVQVGSQDVSKFEEGACTGEVSAKQLSGLVKYVIVGHSERREYFGETNEDVAKKVQLCFKYKLTPIACISSLEQVKNLTSLRPELKPRGYQLPAFAPSSGRGVTSYQFILAYEPLFAVGTGRPDTPQNAQKMAIEIKRILGQNVRVLYGGSVNADNVKSFVGQKDIDGVLVGEASLDAEEFGRIVQRIRELEN